MGAACVSKCGKELFKIYKIVDKDINCENCLSRKSTYTLHSDDVIKQICDVCIKELNEL